MPKYRIRTALAVGLTTVTAAVATAQPAAAATPSCATPGTFPALVLFGDVDQYFLAPGGDFEGAHGWALAANASTTRRRSYLPYIGSQQLELAPGGTATAPPLCVDATRRHLRFVVRASAPSAVLRVEAVVAGQVILLATVNGNRYSDYRLTDPLMVAGPLGLAPGILKQAQLRLAATTGTWQIDGVWVDPRRSG